MKRWCNQKASRTRTRTLLGPRSLPMILLSTMHASQPLDRRNMQVMEIRGMRLSLLLVQTLSSNRITQTRTLRDQPQVLPTIMTIIPTPRARPKKMRAAHYQRRQRHLHARSFPPHSEGEYWNHGPRQHQARTTANLGCNGEDCPQKVRLPGVQAENKGEGKKWSESGLRRSCSAVQ